MGRGGDRYSRVDALLAGGVGGRALEPGRWLVVGALPEATAALHAQGIATSGWVRFAQVGDGGIAAAAPPEGPFAGAIVAMPRGADAARMTLHLVAAQLAPDAELWVGGANDEGIRSAPARMAEVVGEVGEAVPGGHARMHVGRGVRPIARPKLDDWAERVTVDLPSPSGSAPAALVSWPGLFAHGRLDAGTAYLLDHLTEACDPRDVRVLDFACGAGPIGVALARFAPSALVLCDHDALAVEAARRNVPSAEVVCADGVPHPAPAAPYGLVVSNPPIHRGQDRDLQVIERLGASLRGGPLADRGVLVLVTQATVPVPALLGPGWSTARIASDRRFTVWRGSATVASPGSPAPTSRTPYR